MIAAMGFGEFRLCGAADGADNGGAELLQPLAGDEPDTAGGGVEENGIAGLYLIGPADQIFRRHALEHHGGSLIVGDPFRELDDTARRHDAVFGIGAGRAGGIGDPVANPDVFDAGADGFDRARGFHADSGGERKRVETASVIYVDIIQAHVALLDEDFAALRFAERHFHPFHDAGGALFLDLNCFGHRSPPVVLLNKIALFCRIYEWQQPYRSGGQIVTGRERLRD